MLKTFEMKMKALNAQRITREHVGNDRYDTWKLPSGIEFLTIHRNEHITLLAIDGYTVSNALAENKDQRFTLAGFENVMSFVDMRYLPVYQKGKFLAHALYLQPKDTLFTVINHEGGLLPNGPMSAFATVITDDVYEDLLKIGVMEKLDHYPPLDFQPEAVKAWVKEHPGFQGRAESFIEAVNGHIEMLIGQAAMEKTVQDMAASLGLDATVSVIRPEELASNLREMQNNPNNLGTGFTFFNDDGTEMNQDNASIEEFVEAITGVKVEKPIIPESNLPS